MSMYEQFGVITEDMATSVIDEVSKTNRRVRRAVRKHGRLAQIYGALDGRLDASARFTDDNDWLTTPTFFPEEVAHVVPDRTSDIARVVGERALRVIANGVPSLTRSTYYRDILEVPEFSDKKISMDDFNNMWAKQYGNDLADLWLATNYPDYQGLAPMTGGVEAMK